MTTPAADPAPQPADVGAFQRQLQQPVQVGEISAAEAKEIKTVNEMIEQYQKDAQFAQRTLNMARAYRVEYLKGLLTARGLPMDDAYNIDDDSGAISRTHEMVKPDLTVVENEPEPEPAEAEPEPTEPENPKE